MRRALLIVSGIVALTAGASVPALGQSPTTTRPSSNSLAPSSAPPVVLVVPISPPAGGGYGWVGRAIQRDLVADLSQAARVRAIAPASVPPAADAQDALRIARRQGAAYAVYGSAQLSGANLRVTGQVLDVATGQPLAGLKATAPSDDLFPLEDALAGEVIRGLPRSLVFAPPTSPSAPIAAPPPAGPYESYTYAPPLPQAELGYPSDYYSYQLPEPYVYYGIDNYYPYDGYWGYPGYPWWGPDVLIFGGYDRDDFRHHHFDDDRRGYYSRPGSSQLGARGNPRIGGGGRYGSGTSTYGRGFGSAHPGYGGGRAAGGGFHGGGGRR